MNLPVLIKKMVQVKASQRLNPVTGQIEQVKAHTRQDDRSKKINIVSGISGSGKSTYANKLATTYGTKHLEVSNIVKDIVDKTKKSFAEVTPEEIYAKLKTKLKGDPVVISGIRQPEIYDLIAKDLGEDNIHHTYLDISDEEALRRIEGRDLDEGRVHDKNKAKSKIKLDRDLGAEGLKNRAHQLVGRDAKNEARDLSLEQKVRNRAKITSYADELKNVGVELHTDPDGVATKYPEYVKSVSDAIISIKSEYKSNIKSISFKPLLDAEGKQGSAVAITDDQEHIIIDTTNLAAHMRHMANFPERRSFAITDPTKSAEYISTHEMFHTMVHFNSLDYLGDLGEIIGVKDYNMFSRLSDKQREHIKENISEYACYNANELCAEAFAQCRMGVASPLAQKVGAWIDARYKEKK